MKAVVEHSARAVWGVGNTTTEAMDDAQRWIREKPHFCVGKLEFAELSPGANLKTDGETLYQWVQHEKPVQESLL